MAAVAAAATASVTTPVSGVQRDRLIHAIQSQSQKFTDEVQAYLSGDADRFHALNPIPVVQNGCRKQWTSHLARNVDDMHISEKAQHQPQIVAIIKSPHAGLLKAVADKLKWGGSHKIPNCVVIDRPFQNMILLVSVTNVERLKTTDLCCTDENEAKQIAQTLPHVKHLKICDTYEMTGKHQHEYGNALVSSGIKPSDLCKPLSCKNLSYFKELTHVTLITSAYRSLDLSEWKCTQPLVSLRIIDSAGGGIHAYPPVKTTFGARTQTIGIRTDEINRKLIEYLTNGKEQIQTHTLKVEVSYSNHGLEQIQYYETLLSQPFKGFTRLEWMDRYSYDLLSSSSTASAALTDTKKEASEDNTEMKQWSLYSANYMMRCLRGLSVFARLPYHTFTHIGVSTPSLGYGDPNVTQISEVFELWNRFWNRVLSAPRWIRTVSLQLSNNSKGDDIQYVRDCLFQLLPYLSTVPNQSGKRTVIQIRPFSDTPCGSLHTFYTDLVQHMKTTMPDRLRSLHKQLNLQQTRTDSYTRQLQWLKFHTRDPSILKYLDDVMMEPLTINKMLIVHEKWLTYTVRSSTEWKSEPTADTALNQPRVVTGPNVCLFQHAPDPIHPDPSATLVLKSDHSECEIELEFYNKSISILMSDEKDG